MNKGNHWNRLVIQSLIITKINTLKRRANRLLERGETFKGNQTLRIVDDWQRILHQFKEAEIQWPQSGGEGS